MSMATPAFFWFLFAWNTFFHPLTFSLYVSLDLRWVSYRQHIYGSCFCIHSASLCLLVGAFTPFTFNVIINMHVPLAIFVIVLDFGVFLWVFLAVPLVLWDLSTLTRDWTWDMAVKVPSPNHWTTREFPGFVFVGLFSFLTDLHLLTSYSNLTESKVDFSISSFISVYTLCIDCYIKSSWEP